MMSASLIYSTGSISSSGYSVIADVVIRERHTDTLTITQQPVELGAAITDHAFKNPAILDLEYGWSDSSPDAADYGETYVNTVYQTLLSLQASRQLCTIVTTKRPLYKNMLIESVSTETTQETANSMVVSATCREILLVSTGSGPSTVAQSNQATPESTAATQQMGTKSLTVAPDQSSLLRIHQDNLVGGLY